MLQLKNFRTAVETNLSYNFLCLVVIIKKKSHKGVLKTRLKQILLTTQHIWPFHPDSHYTSVILFI